MRFQGGFRSQGVPGGPVKNLGIALLYQGSGVSVGIQINLSSPRNIEIRFSIILNICWVHANNLSINLYIGDKVLSTLEPF